MIPVWLSRAEKYIGLKEVRGKLHSNVIVRFWQAIKAPVRDDETPWCAAFVGAVLEDCGIRSTRSAAARSYLKWGYSIAKPIPGAVVVFWRGNPDGWSGHVGFVCGVTERGNPLVLGGNQGDMVSIREFAKERVLGYRWPVSAALPDVLQPVVGSVLASAQVQGLSTNEA